MFLFQSPQIWVIETWILENTKFDKVFSSVHKKKFEKQFFHIFRIFESWAAAKKFHGC